MRAEDKGTVGTSQSQGLEGWVQNESVGSFDNRECRCRRSCLRFTNVKSVIRHTRHARCSELGQSGCSLTRARKHFSDVRQPQCGVKLSVL